MTAFVKRFAAAAATAALTGAGIFAVATPAFAQATDPDETTPAATTDLAEATNPAATTNPAEATNPAATMPAATVTLNAGATDEAVEAQLATEKDTYKQSETKDGVAYAGTGWTFDAEVTVEVTMPDGSKTLISPVGSEEDVVVDEDGNLSGSVVYYTYEDRNNNGELDADEEGTQVIGEMPVGTYTVTVTQGDVVKTVSFKVVADSTSAKDDTKKDDALAVTGADDAAVLGVLAGGLLLVAAGATMMVVRRRQA